MGIVSTYEIHQNANIKLILHELKHKNSAVNGVLLGRVSGDDAVEIVESVPLFHSQIGVLPPLEIALIMLYTKDASRSWKLVGSDGSIRLKIKEPSANVVLLDYISSGKWNEITDFGEDLDDISKDWGNTELFN